MTRVNSGVMFEYKVRDYFEARGYTVIRSAGSKGPIDLIAFNSSECQLIQCKKEDRHRSYADDIASIKGIDAPDEWERRLWVKHGKDIIIHDVNSENQRVQIMSQKKMNEVIRSDD